MSRYIVSFRNNDNVKKNCIYRVIKENSVKMAIIDETGKEYWINKNDEKFKEFKILYWPWRYL